ncbi:MAG: hypothetical protein Tsb0020_22930 [Haliangiales bacterium]
MTYNRQSPDLLPSDPQSVGDVPEPNSSANGDSRAYQPTEPTHKAMWATGDDAPPPPTAEAHGGGGSGDGPGGRDIGASDDGDDDTSGSSGDTPPNMPEKFDHYQIIEELGKGGMGRVYLAKDTQLDRRVAIKVLLETSAENQEELLREAKNLACIKHDSVVQVYSIGRDHGIVYIVQEYIEGSHLGRSMPWPWDKVLDLAHKLIGGLIEIHQNTIVHCDIKPANVLIDDIDGQPKLCDFGLAKHHVQTPPAREATDGHPPISIQRSPTVPQPTDGPEQSDNSSQQRTPAQPAIDPELHTAGSTKDAGIAGTRGFMAPELFRGDSPSFATDIYAFGVMLYQSISGRLPFDDAEISTFLAPDPELVAPPLAERVSPINPRFAALIDRCIALDPEQRPASAREVADELAQLLPKPGPWSEQPYPGPRPFDVDDQANYFGREGDIDAVLKKLRSRPFVVVSGSSGVGKSSLVRAGVIPRLNDPNSPNIRLWHPLVVVPGPHPLRSLGTALAGFLNDGDDTATDTLRRAPQLMRDQLQRRLARSSGLLIVIDQLEEIITAAADSDEVLAFASALIALTEFTQHIRVLATARVGEVGKLMEIPAFYDAMRGSEAIYPLTPLSSTQLREIITQPAANRGVQFESDEMVDALLRESDEMVDARLPEAKSKAMLLPHLQFALAQLWERRDRDRRCIPARALNEIGGLAGALGHYADHIMEKLAARGLLPAARAILVELANLRDTEVRRSHADLTDGDPARDSTLSELRQSWLLIERVVDGERCYELAHEALATGWQTLTEWRDENQHQNKQRRILAQAADQWANDDKANTYLWDEIKLARVSDISEAELLSQEAEFLRQSRRLARRAKRLRELRITLYGGVLVVAVGLAFAVNHFIAQNRRDRDVAALRAQAAAPLRDATEQERKYWQLRAEQGDILTSIGPDTDNVAERLQMAEASWGRAVAMLPGLTQNLQRSSQLLERAYKLSPQDPALHAQLIQVLSSQARLAYALERRTELSGLIERIALYDEQAAVQWRAPRSVAVLTSPAGRDFTVHRYEHDAAGNLITADVKHGLSSPSQLTLAPGSYVIEIAANDHGEPVRYPLSISPLPESAREPYFVNITLPAPGAIPAGFAFIPAGRFWAGGGGELATERARAWATAPPLHQRQLGPYLIAKHQTTFAEWMTFLRDLPPQERDKWLPNAGTDEWIRVELQPDLDAYRLRLKTMGTSEPFVVREGEDIKYTGREDPELSVQDWTRFPVTGISGQAAQMYAAWLSETGRVPNARLCREDEWLRAGRGADQRLFPHGDRLDANQANVFVLHRWSTAGTGPDEVGAHPESQSPFGLQDMAGNAAEMTLPLFTDADKIVIRSGSFNGPSAMSELINRDQVEKNYPGALFGFRVCADLPTR